MPDLSYLETLIPGFMTAVLVADGELLTPRERLYVRIFVRLVEKAINEYTKARGYIIAQVEEAQRSAKAMIKHGRKLYLFGIINHMENCVNEQTIQLA